MPLLPDDKLGPYEILALIGAGGMGGVYKARDTRLDRAVAIKSSRVEFSKRFEREERAVAALNHPNISHRWWSLPDRGGRAGPEWFADRHRPPVDGWRSSADRRFRNAHRADIGGCCTLRELTTLEFLEHRFS